MTPAQEFQLLELSKKAIELAREWKDAESRRLAANTAAGNALTESNMTERKYKDALKDMDVFMREAAGESK